MIGLIVITLLTSGIFGLKELVGTGSFLLIEFFFFGLLIQILTGLKVTILFIFNISVLIKLVDTRSSFLTVSFLYSSLT